jgi:hypothetical protein
LWLVMEKCTYTVGSFNVNWLALNIIGVCKSKAVRCARQLVIQGEKDASDLTQFITLEAVRTAQILCQVARLVLDCLTVGFCDKTVDQWVRLLRTNSSHGRVVDARLRAGRLRNYGLFPGRSKRLFFCKPSISGWGLRPAASSVGTGAVSLAVN